MDYQASIEKDYKKKYDLVAKRQKELIDKEIEFDLRALQPYEKIANKPDKSKELKPIKSRFLPL